MRAKGEYVNSGKMSDNSKKAGKEKSKEKKNKQEKLIDSDDEGCPTFASFKKTTHRFPPKIPRKGSTKETPSTAGPKETTQSSES